MNIDNIFLEYLWTNALFLEKLYNFAKKNFSLANFSNLWQFIYCPLSILNNSFWSNFITAMDKTMHNKLMYNPNGKQNYPVMNKKMIKVKDKLIYNFNDNSAKYPLFR